MTPQPEKRHVITVTEVYHYTGVNSHTEAFTFALLTGLRERGARYVVLFEWDVQAPWLDLDVASVMPGQSPARALSNPREAAQMLLGCGVPRDNLPRSLRP